MSNEQIQAMYQAMEDVGADEKFHEISEKISKIINEKLTEGETERLCALLCDIEYISFFMGAKATLAFEEIRKGGATDED